MAWTEITRRQYRREGLRYESDTTDVEWLVMEPLLPPPSAAAVDWRRISKRPSPAPLLGHSSLTSASSRVGSQELEIKWNHFESDT